MWQNRFTRGSGERLIARDGRVAPLQINSTSPTWLAVWSQNQPTRRLSWYARRGALLKRVFCPTKTHGPGI